MRIATFAACAAGAMAAGMPEKTMGLYVLLADDTVANYTSTDDWTPALPTYMADVNVLWLAFVNPSLMPDLPPAFGRVGKNKPAGTKVIAAIGGQAYSTKPNPWSWLSSTAAAEAMAVKVSKWPAQYGIDGVDLDLETGAGDTAQAGPAMMAFINKLRAVAPDMIVTQPVFGYPQVKEENYVVNQGGADRVGIMVYSGTQSLNYVKDYVNATSQWQGFPITRDTPSNQVILGSGGDASAATIQQLAVAARDQNLGGIMVWYASVTDTATGKPAIQYGGGQADATVKQTTAEWSKALSTMSGHADVVV
mmetsp:Transcript_10682/g.23544  ORF Transcript_10682/g.23544 Transcript_10682/m.23544 type:complete len:307 (-) Transcript_10682:68-988(-)|eukprot:CAMPEP_0204406622 /NCGR_PEP_ID=MMETSP0470-20130426/8188_1 /ASSEMBLY_ACC=CAM_ASM_000385 /TAXON_ID=2969 /ORGANISM="Oxyrrhis marina" /LENGTH=306 /DNA_ID=CAMNT_0051402199 /DNA_START=32 /DNA_END=952 /DNA_ORIENTATION=-